jgi:hypothetical protein
MGNMLQAAVTIEGTRPLLFHAFTPETIALTRRERTGVAGNDPEEWQRSVLMTAERQLYLDATYVFGCLRDGARFTRKGRGTLQPVIGSTLQINSERVLIADRFVPEPPLPTDPEKPVYLDIRSTRNPTTRARNVRYRVGASPGWRASFEILWDRTLISRGEMEAILHDAGRFAGIGSGRPIGFGRFIVASCDVIDIT